MTSSVTNPVKAFALIALGLAIAAMGIYVANAEPNRQQACQDRNPTAPSHLVTFRACSRP